MTLPSSGAISIQEVINEVGSSGANSLGWIRSNSRSTVNGNCGVSDMNSIHGYAWYQNNTHGNCNNGNCSTNCAGNCGNCGAYNCNCTAIQCSNCTLSGINCANCDTRAWLQPNCNCACSYNCNQNNTGTYNCNCACTTIAVGSCFLPWVKVALADGTFKRIDQVKPGDVVLGARGEHNVVVALDRTVLGNRPMYCVNDEHDTSPEHPHVGRETFHSIDVDSIYDEWGLKWPVIAESGVEHWYNRGLKAGRVKPLQVGDDLRVLDGYKEVSSLEAYNLPPETPLYNLVVSGSHTYFVDGYAVTGWPREDDFDYDEWKAVKQLTLEDYRN